MLKILMDAIKNISLSKDNTVEQSDTLRKKKGNAIRHLLPISLTHRHEARAFNVLFQHVSVCHRNVTPAVVV